MIMCFYEIISRYLKLKLQHAHDIVWIAYNLCQWIQFKNSH